MGSRLNSSLIKILKKRLVSEKGVDFAYLFGSQARNDVGALSDIDIAVHLDNNVDGFAFRLYLTEEIMKATGKEEIDVVIMNNATTFLCYQIIKDGILLKDDKKRRLNFEIRVVKDYLDAGYLRSTQLSYMKEHIKAGTFFG